RMDRHWWNQLICILCLGLGTLCLMTGYDTQSMIVESVLHSVHMRSPDSIAKHAGYYGQGVLYAAYTLSTLFAPWICYRIGSKWSLFAGSVLFSMYQAGFFMLNSYYYYLSQALMGIGFALYYSGQGLYMSEHSTRNTITRNSSLVSSIGNSSMLVGGVVLFIIFYVGAQNKTIYEDTVGTGGLNYRDFSNSEIYVIYGVLLGFTLVSNIIFALMPTKRETTDSELEAVEKSTLRTQLSQLMDTAREPRMLLLTCFFLFYGFHVSYWLGAYPTTFAFTKMLSTNIYLPAYYCTMIGVGNIIVGCYINVFDKRFSDFGLIPMLFSQLLLSAIMYILTVLSTSNLSTIETNDDTSMMIIPTTTICCVIGVLHGMIDCFSCSMRAVICTIALPRKRLQAYSLSKLYQSAASCAAYFFSPYLTIFLWMVLLAGTQCLSAIGFVIVSRQISSENILKCTDVDLKPAKVQPVDKSCPWNCKEKEGGWS
ncbi:hypothetical protein V3C99_014430, partial [Haemonchus contortus]